MDDLLPALVGAAATALVMVISNVSNRRERDIRDIYFRLNKLSETVSRIEGKIQSPVLCFEKGIDHVQNIKTYTLAIPFNDRM